MGFGFFKRKEKKETELKEAEIRVSGLSGWLNENFSDKIEESSKKAKGIRDETIKSFLAIKDAAKALDKASMEGNERIFSAANMVKDQFVKKALSVSESASKTNKESGYMNFSQFCSDMEKTLKDLSSLSPKQGFLLSNYFKKESAPLIEKIRKADDSIKSLRKLLDSDGSMLKTDYLVKTSVKDYSGLSKDLKAVSEKKKQSEDKVKRLGKEIEEKRQELNSLTEGGEHAEMVEAEKSLEEVKESLRETERRISEEISPIERPMKKLDYMIGKNYVLDKDHEWFLSQFLENPLKIMLSEGSEDFLKRILVKVEQLLDENKIILKGKEHGKIRELQKKLDKTIPELKAEYSALMERERMLEKRAKEHERIRVNERMISELIDKKEKERDELSKAIDSLDEDISRKKAQMGGIKESISKTIEANTGYRIKLND